MIDLKDLRENPERYRRAARLKRIDVDIDRLLDLDAARRSLEAQRQKITAEKNAIGKQIGQLAGKLKNAAAGERAALSEEMKQLQARPTELKQLEMALDAQVAELDPKLMELLLRCAQPPDDDVPVGKDDSENVEIKKWGTIRHGVAASTTMAMDTTPNHPVVKSYLEYVPRSKDPKVHELWAKLVHEPAYRAVHRYQPILKKHNKLEEVFRFQDLDALVDRLEASEKKTPEAAAETVAQ